MCELNPQIGRILRPLEISPPYLASLICMRKEGDPELKRKLGIAVSTLHESVDGLQMKGTEIATTFTPIPLPYEMIGCTTCPPEGVLTGEILEPGQH